MPTIYVTTPSNEVFSLEAQEGISLMEVITQMGLPLEAICGGCLSCATCHVYIDHSQCDLFPQKSEEECDMLDLANNVKDNSRLSCQLRIEQCHEGLQVTLAEE